jgi:hypothetical protein
MKRLRTNGLEADGATAGLAASASSPASMVTTVLLWGRSTSAHGINGQPTG